MRDFLFSLRTKALLLVGFAFAVLVGIIGYHTFAERQMRLEFVADHLLDSAKLLAAEQNHVIGHTEQFLNSLLKAQAWRQTIVPEDCQHTLAQRLAEEPRIANISVALPDGSVVCSATPTTRPINLAERPYFKNALASPAVIIGEAVISPITGKRSLPFLRAVRDSSGRTLAVFAVALDLSGLASGVANAKYPNGARVGLIDAKGQVLARYPDVEGWVGKDASGTPFFKAVAAHGGKGTFGELGFDNVPRVYGLARFAETAAGPITLWLGFEEKTVTADVERDFAWTVAFLTGLLLLTFAAVLAGGERLLLRPISVLTAAAHRMGQGDLSARTGLGHARDELGRLAQSFDEMASSLEAKSHHVVLANRAVIVLSTWNQEFVISRDENSLFECMCRAIVEGGYRGAWVGLAMFDEEKTVKPVASWGIDPEFIAGFDITWADAPRGRGPAGAAIRRGTTVIMNDYMTNPETALRHEYARRHRLNSIISLPLKSDGTVIGAVTIHSAETESFGEQEAVLLAEVAAALSSGIAAVRARAARAHLEVSLQSSTDRFRAAAEASPDALFVFKSVRDNAGNIVDLEITEMNARAERQIGMARANAIGKTYLGLLLLYSTKGAFDQYVRVATTGTRFDDEFAYDVPNKGRRWFRQQVVRVGDGIAISLRDITAWKNAGDKIREAEERLRLAMAGARMGAWSADLESGRYTLSEEVGPIFGMPKGAGPQDTKELLEAVHSDDRETLAMGIKRDRTAGQPMRREFRVLWPDGSVHWVEAHSNVICDEAGKPVRSVGVLADITQRKVDMVALQRANRALKTLSAGNEALVHATSESELLHEACRIIVEKGGYRMASVGYPQDDYEKTILLMAWAGVEDGYLTAMKHTWADNELGQRPIAKALRSGRVQIARGVVGVDPVFAPVRDLIARLGYVSNLALPLLDGNRVIGAMSIHASEADAFDDAEILLLQELAENLAYGITTLRTRGERDRIAHAHEHHAAILRKSLEDSIQAIAATVEMRDPYTSGHQKRVAELALAIAREMRLSEERIHGLHLAGVVHDLGKISVPAEILSKPGKLTSLEFMLIKGHAQAGYEILKDIDFPWPIATIVWQHHERLDGSGYPQGLKGEDILLESRIMAVADVVEAMASHRPYRATLGIDVALQEIERGRGIKYDSAVTDACLKLFREDAFALPI